MLPGDQDADANVTKMVILNKTAPITLGDFPTGRKRNGRKRKLPADRAFRRAFDASGLALLHAAVERVHGASLQYLHDRRHKAKVERTRKAKEQRLREEGAREYRRGVQEREEKRAVRLTLGQRQSWRKWSISRKIVGKEDRAERDVRTVKQRRRFYIVSFALNREAYVDGFESAVGMSEEVRVSVAPRARARARARKGWRARGAAGGAGCARGGSSPARLRRQLLHAAW